MDNKQIAHDIAIRLLPRALDRDSFHLEWIQDGNIAKYSGLDPVFLYKTIYNCTLQVLEDYDSEKK